MTPDSREGSTAARRATPISKAARGITRALRDRRGVAALYATLATTAATGFGVLTVDYGRMVVLSAQMQSAADAAALAAATQLDGAPNARTRATALATAAASNSSVLIGNASFTVTGVQYLQSITPEVAATTDADARIARVTLAPQTIELLLKPVLDLISNDNTGNLFTLNASAAAEYAPVVCNAPPLMVCDPTEALGSSGDLRDPANAGRGINVTEASSTAPGNYGLLCPSAGNCGAAAIEAALAATETGTCYGPQVDYGMDVTTAPGQKTGPVADGINNRFDEKSPGSKAPVKPAPNVIDYPRDSNLSSSYLGNGSWDRSGYWSSKHGGPLPGALATASRYQTYLYELGLSYAAHGTETLFPPPSSLPPGFTLVSPPGKNLPTDGAPKNTPEGPERRTLTVAILSCQADSVNGKGTYPTRGRFVDIFLTERDPGGSGKAIVGEVVGSTSRTGNPNYHANVRLVK